MTVGVAVLRGGDLGGSVADGFVAVGGDGGGELIRVAPGARRQLFHLLESPKV